MNLAEGLQEELTRNRELLDQYKEIGSAGTFGHAMIKVDIKAAERAIAEGDVVAQLKLYSKLKGNK